MSPDELNFHHLRYFWAVAREGNLTRAARGLHVSQSVLSAQIRQLEARLRAPLFRREGRRLSFCGGRTSPSTRARGWCRRSCSAR